MKKALLFLLFVPLFSHAQKSMQHYYSMNQLTSPYKNSYYEEPFASEKLRKQLQIKDVQIVETNGRGREKKSRMTFNTMGKTLFSENSRRTLNHTYLHDTLEISKVYKRKRKVFETKSTYENGQPTSVSSYSNGKLASSVTLQYNAQQQPTESVMKIGKKTYVIQHTYGADNKLSKTVYFVQGKIKKEWIYACKPEGEIVASKTEAMSSFCTYQSESADGSYSTFTRSLREGKPYLFKQTYNKDSVLLSRQSYLRDSILVWESKKEGNVETMTSYKESGKLRYKQTHTFDAAGRTISREYISRNRPRTASKSTFELNADGTTKEQRLFYKGKLQQTITYTYGFN